MIDRNGHIKLTDFGLSESNINKKINTLVKKRSSLKKNNKDSDKRVFGTVNYLSPELILAEPHGKEADYWALGVMIYELIVGDPPFSASSTEEIFENIKNLKINWPKISSNIEKSDNEFCISEEAYELISGLLTLNPKDRLGSLIIEEIKEMDFFKGKIFNINLDIDWSNLKAEKFLFVPRNESKKKSMYFDKSKVKEAVKQTQDVVIDLEPNKHQFEELKEAPTRRDDLLHKRNMEHFNDRIKKVKIYLQKEYFINNIISDLNTEDY